MCVSWKSSYGLWQVYIDGVTTQHGRGVLDNIKLKGKPQRSVRWLVRVLLLLFSFIASLDACLVVWLFVARLMYSRYQNE